MYNLELEYRFMYDNNVHIVSVLTEAHLRRKLEEIRQKRKPFVWVAIRGRNVVASGREKF